MEAGVSPTLIRNAVRVLKEGGLVIYPTETAYAIGCDARNKEAVEMIYALKRRRKKKPLALIAADLRMVKRFFKFPISNLQSLVRYWPGPLTLILQTRDQRIARAIGRKDVGVRVSSHPVARALSRGLGAPIVATSANRSGKGNCYSVRCALRSLLIPRKSNLQPLISNLLTINGGILPRRKPSTIVAFRRGKLVLVRKGPVKIRA